MLYIVQAFTFFLQASTLFSHKFFLSLLSANKFWSGLLESYYLPRASTYFESLSKSLKTNESFKLEEWRKEWIKFSNNWQAGTEIYPVKAKGDALAISTLLYKKYFSWKLVVYCKISNRLSKLRNKTSYLFVQIILYWESFKCWVLIIYTSFYLGHERILIWK